MTKEELIIKMAEELFDFIKELGLSMNEFIATPYGKLRVHNIPRATYYYQLKKFEKRGLIKKVRKQYGATYVLTERAKQLRIKPRQKMNRTDGLSTIIMFDIPEEKHKARDNFRRYLIKNGYVQIQESVFISPCRIFDELKEFIKELGIKTNVTVVSGKIDHLLI